MVNYFSIINDVENKVTVLYDKKLYAGNWQSFHPMDNHASICINKDGVDKVKDLAGRDASTFQITDFEDMGAAAGAQPAAPAKAKPEKPKKNNAE